MFNIVVTVIPSEQHVTEMPEHFVYMQLSAVSNYFHLKVDSDQKNIDHQENSAKENLSHSGGEWTGC